MTAAGLIVPATLFALSFLAARALKAAGLRPEDPYVAATRRVTTHV